WLGDKGYFALLAVFTAQAGLGYWFFDSAHRPQTATGALVILLIALCITAAKAIPNPRARPFARTPGNIAIYLSAVLSACATIFAGWGVYRISQSFPLHIAVLTGLMMLFTWLMQTPPPLPRRSQIVLVAGLLTPELSAALTQGGLIQGGVMAGVLVAGWTGVKDEPPVNEQPAVRR